MRKLSQRRNHRDTAIIRACRQFTLSSDDSTQLLTVDDEIIEDLLEANKPIFLISMKRPAAMNKVNDLLERIDKGNLRAFIIDDEGDQASLNTKKNKTTDASATYAAIIAMKDHLKDYKDHLRGNGAKSSELL